MHHSTFDLTTSFSVLNCLLMLKINCNSNDLWSKAEHAFAIFICSLVPSIISAGVCHHSLLLKSFQNAPNSYCEILNCLLETYTNEDVISDAKDKIPKCPLVHNRFSLSYMQTRWGKSLRHSTVFMRSRYQQFLSKVFHFSSIYLCSTIGPYTSNFQWTSPLVILIYSSTSHTSWTEQHAVTMTNLTVDKSHGLVLNNKCSFP